MYYRRAIINKSSFIYSFEKEYNNCARDNSFEFCYPINGLYSLYISYHNYFGNLYFEDCCDLSNNIESKTHYNKHTIYKLNDIKPNIDAISIQIKYHTLSTISN